MQAVLVRVKIKAHGIYGSSCLCEHLMCRLLLIAWLRIGFTCVCVWCGGGGGGGGFQGTPCLKQHNLTDYVNSCGGFWQGC